MSAAQEAEELCDEDIDSFLEEGENWGAESDDDNEEDAKADNAKGKEKDEGKEKKKLLSTDAAGSDSGKASEAPKVEETEIERGEDGEGEQSQTVPGPEGSEKIPEKKLSKGAPEQDKQNEQQPVVSQSAKAEKAKTAPETKASLPAPPPPPAMVPDMSKETPKKGGAASMPGALPSPPPAATWNEDESEEESAGWGGAWGGWGQSLSAAVKTMANDFSDMGKTLADSVNESLEEEARIGEAPPSAPPPVSVADVDGFDSRRSKFLNTVEDQTSTDVLKGVDEKIGFLATGAASFFGSVLGSVGNVVEGGVQNATMLASSAANEFQETFQQGVSDVAELTKKSGAVKVASAGLKIAADQTVRLAEMSLDKAGNTAKGILDMADAVTGMDSTKGGGMTPMKEDEDNLSFGHEFFVYGGSDHLEELENISVKCGTICQNIKVKLSGDNKVEYEDLVKSLGQRFDLTFAELEGQTFDPLQSYNAIRKRCEDCISHVESFVNEEMSSDLELDKQIQSIKNEAVQQIAEQTSVSVHYLLKLARSIAEPLGLFDSEEDIEWPEDPINVASILRATIESISKDLEALKKKFSSETVKFSKGNEELKQPVTDLTTELDDIHESALQKVHEALRDMLFIIAASSFSR